jgi:hypothetical protein
MQPTRHQLFDAITLFTCLQANDVGGVAIYEKNLK